MRSFESACAIARLPERVVGIAIGCAVMQKSAPGPAACIPPAIMPGGGAGGIGGIGITPGCCGIGAMGGAGIATAPANCVVGCAGVIGPAMGGSGCDDLCLRLQPASAIVATSHVT